MLILIQAELNKRGVRNKGKPLSRTTIYFILKSEKYAGKYTYNGEDYNNMFPRIVPEDVYQLVRSKTEENYYGKHDSSALYLLKNLIKCGYCGKPIASEFGTGKNGTVNRYYKCSGRKHEGNCKKSMVRKEILEEIVINATIKAFKKAPTLIILQNYYLEN